MIPPDVSEVRSCKWFRLFEADANFDKIDLVCINEDGDCLHNAYLYFSDEELRQMDFTNSWKEINMHNNFKIGDMVMGKRVHQFGTTTWMNVYEILAVENANRFSKPDQLLTVKITTTNGKLVEDKTKRWTDQLF